MTHAQRMQHVSSGSLALLVHGMLLLGLMVGVSWKIPPQLPIEADLWLDLPPPPPSIPAPEFAAQPESLPPLPNTAPVPDPEALPEPAPAPPDAARIALEQAERKRLAEQQQAERRQAALQRKLDEQQRAEALRQAEQARAEKDRAEKDRLEKLRIDNEQREQTRRQIDQELARQMREELDAEAAQLGALQRGSRAGNQARMVRDFQERIRAKIMDALVLPQNIRGDAEVTVQVDLLPNGEVLRVTLLRSSGQALYDSAVERAIFRASPLPLPGDREAAKPFRDGLTLKFRPSDDMSGMP
jgi:colicin import membrane protein